MSRTPATEGPIRLLSPATPMARTDQPLHVQA